MGGPSSARFRSGALALLLASGLAAFLTPAVRGTRLLPAGGSGKGEGKAHPDTVGRLMQALEYLERDYREAVGGAGVGGPDQEELAEQKEFVARAGRLLSAFPASPAKSVLAARMARLRLLVDSMAPSRVVEGELRSMMEELLVQADAPTPPGRPVEADRGRALFAEKCAACHGPGGRGDGPAGSALNPRPADLADGGRLGSRGPLPIYRTLRYGIEGTGMPSFRTLDSADLWALAYFVLSLDRSALAGAPAP